MKPESVLLASEQSPTGQAVIPSSWVPAILLAMSVLQLLAAEIALPGPWTPERYFMVSIGVLNLLVGGSLQGIRMHRRVRR